MQHIYLPKVLGYNILVVCDRQLVTYTTMGSLQTPLCHGFLPSAFVDGTLLRIEHIDFVLKRGCWVVQEVHDRNSVMPLRMTSPSSFDDGGYYKMLDEAGSGASGSGTTDVDDIVPEMRKRPRGRPRKTDKKPVRAREPTAYNKFIQQIMREVDPSCDPKDRMKLAADEWKRSKITR